jgi:hypothetical protein
MAPSPDYGAGTDGNIYSRKTGQWRKLKALLHRSGYPTVMLFADNKPRRVTVHRLVCAAFHGPQPSRRHLVRHINGNRLDSRPENLAWGTPEENWIDRVAHGRGVSGADNPNAKLTEEERANIRWAIHRGLCSIQHAARVFQISPSAISNLCNQQRLAS